MALRIVMLGAPGAGKGTQALRMAEVFGIPHISTGDIFRKNLKEGTPLGKRVQEYLNSGALVPDELTCEIVADRLAQPDCEKGFILDGFPRSIPQAEMLEKYLQAKGQQITAAINIDVPDAEIVERLSARRTDPVTGQIYNLKFSPPPAEILDRLIQREDDKEETVLARLRTYHETTEPIIAWYEQRGLLRTVSGSGATPDQVFEQIMAVVSDLK